MTAKKLIAWRSSDYYNGIIPIGIRKCARCHCERSEAISLPFVFEIAAA